MVTKSLEELRVQTIKDLDKMSTRLSDRGRKEWARVRGMTEEEIEANALADEDNPPVSDAILKTGQLVKPL